MIILLSKDFSAFAAALQKQYSEPVIQCLEHSDWPHDLVTNNDNKFISRLSIIGHSDSFYGEEQTFFGGNLNERVMLMDEFAHSLISTLKYNERLKPGFCQHLKHIDIIDCHIGERKFIAQTLAEHLQDDVFLRDYGAHIKISSFANSAHPTAGTVLMPHALHSDTLSFYTFDSAKAFANYKEVHHKLTELRSELHHMHQMPGHTDHAAIAQLEKKCDMLQTKEKTLLKNKTHKKLHISDPRHFLDHHKACQITVADAQPLPYHAHEKHSKHKIKKPASHSPQFFSHKSAHPHPKHTSYLDGNTLRTAKLEEEFEPHKKFR